MPLRNFVKGEKPVKVIFASPSEAVCVCECMVPFGKFHLLAVLCACVLEPVFMILPSSGQDGFGFSFLCPARLTNFCHFESLASFFSFSFSLPFWLPCFPDPYSCCCPGGIAGSGGGMATRRMKALAQGKQISFRSQFTCFCL